MTSPSYITPKLSKYFTDWRTNKQPRSLSCVIKYIVKSMSNFYLGDYILSHYFSLVMISGKWRDILNSFTRFYVLFNVCVLFTLTSNVFLFALTSNVFCLHHKEKVRNVWFLTRGVYFEEFFFVIRISLFLYMCVFVSFCVCLSLSLSVCLCVPIIFLFLCQGHIFHKRDLPNLPKSVK